MVDTPISIDSTSAPTTVSLDSGQSDNYLLSPDLITNRSFKVAYALAGTPAEKPQPEIESNIQQGLEAPMRQETAATLTSDASNKRYDLLTKTLSAKQGPLTPDDLTQVDSISGYNFPYKYPLDPNSVFEISYGKQFSSELGKFAQKLPDTNFWNYGQMVARNDIEAANIFGDVTTAQHQYLTTKYQNASSLIDNQSYLGFGLDVAKTFFPTYQEFKLRGSIPGVPFFSGMLDSQLEEQRVKLHDLPFDKFTQTVDTVYDHLSQDNPTLAASWLSAMMGQSTSDRILNKLNTINDLTLVPAVFKIGAAVYTRAALFKDVNNAYKTALKSSTQAQSKADILTSVGDLPSAGVLKATDVLSDRVTGTATPLTDGLATLPDYFNILKKDISTAPNLSQAHQNVLLEQTEGSIARALTLLANTVRPTRVNLEGITGQTLYKVEKTLTDRYPGEYIPRVDDPFFEPMSKTWFSKLWWGKNFGEDYINYHEAADGAAKKGFRVTYDAEHLAELDARIANVKSDIGVGPDMHEDTAGLNYYNSLQDTLKTLEDKRASVSKPGGAQIEQQGNVFFVTKYVPYRETDRALLSLVANPENPLTVSPDSWTKFIPYFNYARSAEDTFSAEARANRKAAIYPQATYLAMVKEEGKIMSDFLRGATRNDPITGEVNPFYKKGVPIVRSVINKERNRQFQEVLDYSQKNHDPVTKVEGYYFTPDELNHHYLTTYQRPASFEETQAYEAVKRWDALQRVFTQTMVYRNEARLGNENHILKFTTSDGKPGQSQEFVGAVKTAFPRSRGTMLVMGDTTKESSVKNLDRMSVKAKDEYAEMMKNGYRLIQLHYPDRLPFKDLGIQNSDRLIHYVLTPNSESSALKWDSVPSTGGGRFVYDYTHYLKIPNMKYEPGKTNYLGDITVAPVAYKSLGEDLSKKYNITRKLIDEGKEAEAKAHYINNGLEGAFESWSKFRSKFDPYRDENGILHDPLYSSKEDMRVVPRGKTIVDLDKVLEEKYGPQGAARVRNTWRDSTRENNPGKNFQVQFTGERDAREVQAIDDIGTTGKPIYNRTDAQKVDPLSMLNRGMRSTVNSLFMDDYKTYAVNSWLKEATGSGDPEKNWLKERDSTIWSSPFATFKTITKDSFKSGAPAEEVQKLLANHFKIDQLVGTPTVLDSFVHSIAQNLSDAAYRKLGPTAASYITPTWLLPKLQDPFGFIRSVTFNAYLGLFSPAQLLVQSMTYLNMLAISPVHGTQGTVGAYLHYLSRFNQTPSIIAKLDEIATRFGYKPGEWTEAMRTLEDVGFSKVGAEHTAMSNMHRNNIIQNGVDRFLEWGRKPFQWGEQNSRIGAWYVAAREFRANNPTGKLSEMDKAAMLDRADFYTGNMSTASHSAVNAGILSLPTQFYMYTKNLAEIFWSNSRLGGTLAERNMARLRLMAVNGAAFGLPMAAGVTGFPISDYLRQELLENGYFGVTPSYVVGKNFVESLLNEGALAGLLAAGTGKWYNVGPRLGLQGLSNIKDTLNQDASLWKVAGGASASLTMNTFNNGIYPFFYKLFPQLMKGDFSQVKTEDMIDIFKEAQTVNSGWSWWVAMNTGKWINKNSDLISDTSKANASFMFLTGLRETKQTDIWNKESDIKNRDELQKYALKQFGIQMNRAIMASVNNDPQQAQAFRDKAIAWLPASDFPPEKLGQAIMRAMRGAENLIDRIDKEFYIDKAPQAKRDNLRKAFEYIRQNR